MSTSYGHIVYTRCGPGRTLDGAADNASGFGIYSMTRDIPGSGRDELFQKTVVTRPYDADACVFAVPAVGAPMLGQYSHRTKEALEEAAALGLDSRETHVSEWLVGPFVRRASDYIASPFWQAGSRPIADYYRQSEPVPMGEPIDADAVAPGPVDRAAALAFARDGRQDAVRAAVSALLQEFDQPESGRRFVVIRDSEANARLWIAAILNALPVACANRVSFNTGTANLDDLTEHNHPVDKATGRAVAQRNLQDPGQELRPWFMLCGISPEDPKSRQAASPRPNAPYLLIDGEARAARFQTGESARRAYIRAIVSDDAAVERFCADMDTLEGVPMGTRLMDLFDAHAQMLDMASCDYEGFVKALGALEGHLTAESEMTRAIMDELCAGGRYFEQFAARDEQNGLALFKRVENLARRFKYGEAVNQLGSAAQRRFMQLLKNPQSAGALGRYAQDLNRVDSDMFAAILRHAVDDKKLSALDPAALAKAPGEYVLKLMDIVSARLRQTHRSWADIIDNPDYAAFSDALAARAAADEALTGDMLARMQNDGNAVEAFARAGAAQCANDRAAASWWERLIQNDVPIEMVCRIIRDRGGDAEQAEDVLCAAVREQGISDGLVRLFDQYAAEAGAKFFPAWIEAVRQRSDRLAQLRRAFAEMDAHPAAYPAREAALWELDGEIRLDRTKQTLALVEVVGVTAGQAGIGLTRLGLWDFLEQMTSPQKGFRREKEPIIDRYEQANPDYSLFGAPRDLLASELGSAFMDTLEAAAEEPAAHLIALFTFQFEDKSAEEEYLDAYADMLAENAVRRRRDTLSSAIAAWYDVQSSKPPKYAAQFIELVGVDELKKGLKALLNRIMGLLEDRNTDGVAKRLCEQAEKAFDKNVAKQLQSMLEIASEKYHETHQSVLGTLAGGLKRLWGKKDD